jgi:DNA-binding NarL/FixJ family response regulator
VVEDFAPWRHFVIAQLSEIHDMRIVGVVSDGLEAVLKAAELQPDLILLDVGLPKMNGIEAARRIRKVAPKSKILFLTQELDVDVARVALSEGHGYVVKSDADNELITAVEAVLQGKKFVSLQLSRQADHVDS